MGHTQFSTLPRSKQWHSVVECITAGGNAGEIATLSAEAAANALKGAADNPVYRAAVDLLVRIPVAAGEKFFPAGLAAIGLDGGSEPDLTDLVFAAGERLDQVADRDAGHGDFGELSRRALLAALSSTIGRELPGLLEATPADVHVAVRRLSQPREFTGLARAFYTRLLSETLFYFLDRTLGEHVGDGQRFADVGERSHFAEDVRTYCHEATRIVHEYSAGWYGVHVWRDGDLSAKAITGFGAFALQKIVEELRRRNGAS